MSKMSLLKPKNKRKKPNYQSQRQQRTFSRFPQQQPRQVTNSNNLFTYQGSFEQPYGQEYSHEGIIDESKDPCVFNLLRIKSPNCTQINNQHLPPIEGISHDMLFVNNYEGVAMIDDE
ncbi:hypothetical protein DOY81_007393 [Sarcophaga bullata]|nr:hypothetical protein DOY81_007393 [Sarcophaga bullata]